MGECKRCVFVLTPIRLAMKNLFVQFPTLLGLGGTHEVLGLSGITEADKTAYVNNNYATAETAGRKYNMNPVVILAQGAMESAWGTSYMAKNIFNFFGITASGKANEYWNGDFYVSKSSGLKFRKYKSTLDCFYDFARLISSNYKAAFAVSFSIPDYAREISNSPYAEQDPASRAIYRKAVISNAAYVLKVKGQSSASAVLTTEASKVTIPASSWTPAKQETPGTSIEPPADHDNTREGSNVGLLVAFGLTAATALLVFNMPLNNKKLAT